MYIIEDIFVLFHIAHFMVCIVEGTIHTVDDNARFFIYILPWMDNRTDSRIACDITSHLYNDYMVVPKWNAPQSINDLISLYNKNGSGGGIRTLNPKGIWF